MPWLYVISAWLDFSWRGLTWCGLTSRDSGLVWLWLAGLALSMLGSSWFSINMDWFCGFVYSTLYRLRVASARLGLTAFCGSSLDLLLILYTLVFVHVNTKLLTSRRDFLDAFGKTEYYGRYQTVPQNKIYTRRNGNWSVSWHDLEEPVSHLFVHLAYVNNRQ